MLFSAVVSREEKLYVALAPDLDVASRGKSIEEAVANLEEALRSYSENKNTTGSWIQLEAPFE